MLHDMKTFDALVADQVEKAPAKAAKPAKLAAPADRKSRPATVLEAIRADYCDCTASRSNYFLYEYD